MPTNPEMSEQGNSVGARPSDQALAVPVEPVSRLDPSGFDPSRYEYRFSISEGHERHDWIAYGRYGAINIWAEPSSPGWGDNWIGGIEGHAKQPAEYQNAEQPTHDLCWLLLGPCWHDGSSLQFSEQVERRLPPPTGGPMSGKVLDDLKTTLRGRYRCWLAEDAIATEARRAETENTGSVHEGAGPSGHRPNPSIEQLQRINAELREGLEQASRALKPIADRVFNDNGDHAISTAPFEDTVFSDCYFAAKRIRTLLSKSEGGHE